MTFLDDPSAEMRRYFSFGLANQRDLAALQLTGDLVNRCARCCEGVDLGLVFAHPQSAHNIDRPFVDGSGQVRQKLNEESGPHLIADCDALRTLGELADQR
jgi:hypothetical protein